jgi:hypothetical protein
LLGDVQSGDVVAPTPWTARFARRRVADAIGCSRSARRAIAGTRTARRPVARRAARRLGASPVAAIEPPRKGGSITAIISARIAPA